MVLWNSQENIANVVLFCNLATKNPRSVAQDGIGYAFANGGVDSLPTNVFVPAFHWMFLGLKWHSSVELCSASPDSSHVKVCDQDLVAG